MKNSNLIAFVSISAILASASAFDWPVTAALANSALNKEVESLIDHGEELYGQHRYDDAIKTYQAAVTKCGDAAPIDAQHIELYASKIKCLLCLARAQDETDKKAAASTRADAISLSNTAMASLPNNVPLLTAAAESEGSCGYADMVSGNEKSARLHNGQAVIYYDRIIKISPSGEAYCGKAYALSTQAHTRLSLPFRVEYLENAFESFHSAIKAGYSTTRAVTDCARVLTELSSYYAYMDEKEDSKKLAAEAVLLFDKAFKNEPSSKSSSQAHYVAAKQLAAGTFKDVAIEQEVKAWNAIAKQHHK